MRSTINARCVFLKGICLLLLIEFLVVAAPMPLGTASVFALLGIKRERLPLSTISPFDDALDVGNLDAMLASHVVSNAKESDELRVVVLGDSTFWGLQLNADEVLPGQLNRLALTCGSKRLRFYNLSFPRSSASKDILILDHVLSLKPDAVIWPVTWYTLMPKTRVDHWIITQNPSDYLRLGRRFDFLPRDYVQPNLAQRLFDRNRSLFRVLRFQMYALVQLATRQDQVPGPPQVPAHDLSADETFEGLKPPTLRSNQVSIDQVEDLYDLAGDVPILLINEPILIMQGIPNSDVRYNGYYPRWVYDQYRGYLGQAAAAHGWRYLDLWDMFPTSYFADTPLHLTPYAHRALAQFLARPKSRNCAPKRPAHS